MAEETKFSKEEIDSVKEIRETYFAIKNTFGQLGVSKLRLEQDFEAIDKAEDNLKKTYKETQEKEKNLVDSITKKYGEGQFNLETGTFTPTVSES
mgnify:CR=1 FL=1